MVTNQNYDLKKSNVRIEYRWNYSDNTFGEQIIDTKDTAPMWETKKTQNSKLTVLK